MTPPQPVAHVRRARCRRSLVALVVAAVLAPWPGMGTGTQAETAPSRFPEIGRVPLLTPPSPLPHKSGWLILNPVTRRGYQVFEGRTDGALRTIVQSFDLDTLRPLRRAEFAGLPIVAGKETGDLENTNGAAELVHAVDPEGRRLYLALSQQAATDQTPLVSVGAFGTADAKRPLARFLMVDEVAFDRCAGSSGCAFTRSFREPPSQERFHVYWPVGMSVARRQTIPGAPGRLLVMFAQANPNAAATSPAYDHTLAQWDTSGLRADVGDEFDTERHPTTGLTVDDYPAIQQAAPAGSTAASALQLGACRNAPLASAGAGSYQWGLLVTADAVWTACQAAEGAGAALRVPVDPDTGFLDPGGAQELFRLSKATIDVLTDPGGERLLLRSNGGGHTWWVFDTALRRFRGAIAAKASDPYSLAAGLDPTTGRLYQLTEDHAAFLGGQTVPFRGGFSFSDTRLEPAPPLENARPELAYPVSYAIKVDPVTRRVFVRRANASFSITPTYPGVNATTPAPAENFYRVLLDNVPLTEPPPPADDSAFTTDVPESSLTRASYLGTGSGYGARTLLIGGVDAASNRNGAVQQSPCAKDDRELLAGAVGGAETSDLSTAAEAAGLDAGSRTRDDAGAPLTRCRPRAPQSNRTEPQARELDARARELDRCAQPPTAQGRPGGPGLEVDEAAFDEIATRNNKTYDDNGDGCPDRDGDNRYRTACTGDGEGREARGPETNTTTLPHTTSTTTVKTGKQVSRRDFKATAECRHAHGRAEASATGGFTAPFLTAAGAPPDTTVTVGEASSTVEVRRQAGKGITVEVDSIARDVVIPGVGTIGLVRGEATVTSTGRPGGATAVYRRTVCDIDLPGLNVASCLSDEELVRREAQVNQALGTRGRIRFRPPDPTLFDGSPSGYKAGVQRPALDGFEDVRIARDVSPALPAMELVLFNGDGSAGTGRQFVHLAGVQAGTSYGIACLYGQRADGRCASLDDAFDTGDDDEDSETTALGGAEPGEPETVTVVEHQQGDTQYLPGRQTVKAQPLWKRILVAPVNLAKDVLRLLFANPAEFGLMAAVWALLWAPCWLGERRRNIRDLRARRAAFGGVA